MNQDGEVCLGFPVLTNVLRCPGDRVPVVCCVKVNDLDLKGRYISNKEALSAFRLRFAGHDAEKSDQFAANVTADRQGALSFFEFSVLFNRWTWNFCWVFTIFMYETRIDKVVA